MLNSLRIVFFGSSYFSAYFLKKLILSSYNIVGVFTCPSVVFKNNKKSYSNNSITNITTKYNLLLFQPSTLLSLKIKKKLFDLNIDIIIVVSYGLIFPQSILDIPKMGCINVHGSLLPRGRGASPIQNSILLGDKKTGVTVIKMDSGIDTGCILNSSSCYISSTDTTYTLSNKLMKIGFKVLILTITQLFNNTFTCISQNNKYATYTKKIKKHDARLNWFLSADYLEKCIRAFNPWPISYFYINKICIKVWKSYVIKQKVFCSINPGTVLKINKNGIYVITGKNILLITLLQPENKNIIKAYDFYNSRFKWFFPGIILN